MKRYVRVPNLDFLHDTCVRLELSPIRHFPLSLSNMLLSPSFPISGPVFVVLLVMEPVVIAIPHRARIKHFALIEIIF